jgi:hypothetical protein
MDSHNEPEAGRSRVRARDQEDLPVTSTLSEVKTNVSRCFDKTVKLVWREP